MCRFTFYRGELLQLSDLVTEPENSLIHQSYAAQEREEPLNGDGFGLAWYVKDQREPAFFRSITPAWSNQNLECLARVLRSDCVLAHVRAASHGLEVTEKNCHPFTCDRFALMHNGEVGAFPAVRRRLLESLSDEAFSRIRGTTDSEHLFAAFMDELRKEEPSDGCSAMAAALERAIARILELVERHGDGVPSFLNVVVTDGEAAVVSRFTSSDSEPAHSLYVSHGARYVCEDGVCRMEAAEGASRAVLVSSEPLTDDVHWDPVPENHVVSIHEGLGVDVREMNV
ncbi:MAG: class II glutamine amidotransferase [Gemmatimonadetes bacterium]|nr:class II glutamine amidotransferase [Gemmatimonadota bacterium]NIR77946.1 class II glutamine amidotransferase [Gemmatimonadota bacterium]NIT87166.1 class II glutamine amidotransferase [Gemmatimonadota bacterium]NIU30333.1 class II glutamine amidotransferase [Gemmatimonadota bacterium]NIU35224.1 class II glutamine amidotransferase [Gemmatimonadota bacterium]